MHVCIRCCVNEPVCLEKEGWREEGLRGREWEGGDREGKRVRKEGLREGGKTEEKKGGGEGQNVYARGKKGVRMVREE